MHTILHVGCGGRPLPTWMNGKETRLDIDSTDSPDIVADMRDFSAGKFDFVFCSHALEHLYPHDVIPTLQNFRNALNEGGAVVIIVPNLADIKPTKDVVYMSDAGPVTGLDMIYGMARLIKDKPYMAHHTGFTPDTLESDMIEAGFSKVIIQSDSAYNLIGIGIL